MLLEEGNRLLNEAFLVVQETELKCGISLGLGLVLCFSDVHQLTEVVDGHLHVSALGMHIGEELVRFTLLVSRASLKLFLTHLEEPIKTGDGLV